MEPDLLIILDYSLGRLIRIHLTDSEREESKNYGDFETYISEVLEERYHFRLKDSYWLLTDVLEETEYFDGSPVDC